MTTETNAMTVPEIRDYRREVGADEVVVTYEVRWPGEQEWRPVTRRRPYVEAVGWADCETCGEHVPRASLSGGVCIPCRWPHGD